MGRFHNNPNNDRWVCLYSYENAIMQRDRPSYQSDHPILERKIVLSHIKSHRCGLSPFGSSPRSRDSHRPLFIQAKKPPHYNIHPQFLPLIGCVLVCLCSNQARSFYFRSTKKQTTQSRRENGKERAFFRRWFMVGKGHTWLMHVFHVMTGFIPWRIETPPGCLSSENEVKVLWTMRNFLGKWWRD